MKKLLSWALTLTMLPVCLPNALAEEEKAWKVGDQAANFTLTEVTPYDMLGAQILTFGHDKTGAEVMWIKNDDTNRLFSMSFRTPALDDTGTPHVFEHSTLDGSKKYPYKELFFNVSSQTYNTYMNASTYTYGFTCYHHTSLSEEQLLATTDFYVDSVFNPMVMEDESIFREEAWRYAMDSLEDDLTIEGTVYSEMSGAYSIAHAHNQNNTRAVYPGSLQGNTTGGNPVYIPDMTWDSIREYHDLYYHPSNSLTVLYGSFDHVENFLSLLDGYFSQYDKKEFVFDRTGTVADKSDTLYYTFPVTADTDPKGGSIITMTWPVEDATEEQMDALDLLTTVLNSSASPLGDVLREKLPTAEVSTYISNGKYGKSLIVEAGNVNAEDAPVLQQAVREALEKVAAEPFSAELLDSVSHSERMNTLLVSESGTIGEDILSSVLYYWYMTDKPYQFAEDLYTEEHFARLNESGAYSAAVKDLILKDGAVCVTVVTSPEVGGREAQDEALKASLAEKKAAMTDEEKQAIVDATLARGQEESAEGLAEALRSLQAVSIDTLPEEVREYEITDETDEKNIRRLFARANTDGLGMGYLMLDASAIPQEALLWYRLYVQLLGQVDTENYTRGQLAQAFERYLYNYSSNTAYYTPDGETGHPFFRLNFIALDDEMDEAYALLYETLFASDYSKVDQIRDFVSGQRTSLKNSLTSNPVSLAYNYAESRYSDSSAYVFHTQLLPYWEFLGQVEEALETSPEAVTGALETVRTMLKNSWGAVSGYAGNEKGYQSHLKAAGEFLDKLDNQETQPAAYTFDVPGKKEAIILDANVNYNVLTASWEELGLEDYSADLDVLANLLSDAYLMPGLRDVYGAYGAYAVALADGFLLYTYRDPNVGKSYEVYKGIGDFAAGTQLDQETLNGYILSTYAGYAQSSGELSGAYAAMTDVMNGESAETTLEYMRQIKGVKAENIAGYADMLNRLNENGGYVTAGGAAAINGEAALFDRVLNPFGSVDATQVVLTDVPEDSAYYDAVRYVYENHLMEAADGETFGVSLPATLGELAGSIYGVVGGDASAQAEAVSFLAGHGLLPEESPDTVLTREQVCGYLPGLIMGLFGQELPSQVDAAAECADGAEIAPECVSGVGLALTYELALKGEDGTFRPKAEMTREELAQVLYGLFAE